MIDMIFKNKKVDFTKLEPFGFTKKDDIYTLETALSESGFRMVVTIGPSGEVAASVFDDVMDEPYTLHLLEDSAGSFVGNVRAQYEEILIEIADRCFYDNVFKTPQAKEIIEYVKSTYGDELEFLWKKFPDNAIWRRQDTQKWYAALLTVSKKKLSFDSDEMVEIIDFRVPPEDLPALVDNVSYFPGYHMNKKHWATIILDGSVPLQEICDRIDASYRLAVK